MKEHKIIVKQDGKLQTRPDEYDCPFWQTNGCGLDNEIPCKYGLTEIRVPKKCPLKKGVTIEYAVK